MPTRVIFTIDRFYNMERAHQVYKAILDASYNSSYFVGIDFAGNPTKNNFRDYIDLFRLIKNQGIKTTIHCAEVPGSFEETDSVLDFLPDRIGHFNFFDEKLFWKVLGYGIPIEMCPSSNL